MEHIDNYDNHFVHIWNILIFFNYYFLSAIFFSGFLSMQIVSSIIEKCFTKYMFKVYKQSLLTTVVCEICSKLTE